MNLTDLDERPVVVAIAGSNGAGKSTFYYSHLSQTGLRYVNADVLALQLNLDPYVAAQIADRIRRQLVLQNESFVFETVFSDPVGDKLTFLKDAVSRGYNVILCFIRLTHVEQSVQRVAMRVTQGGHDVPDEKLLARFPRTLANLRRAIEELPRVYVYDNSDLRRPFRMVAAFRKGELVAEPDGATKWLKDVLG